VTVAAEGGREGWGASSGLRLLCGRPNANKLGFN